MIEIEANHEYHIVEVAVVTEEMLDWCHTQLGETGRYFLRHHRLFFYNERDHLMFVLRFS